MSQETIAKIVDIQVNEVVDRLAKKEINLSLTKEVSDYLAKEGYDPKFGARPLRRVIQSKILTPLANMMVGEGMMQGGTVNVSMKKEELSFDIKRTARRKKPAKKTVVEKTVKRKETVAA